MPSVSNLAPPPTSGSRDRVRLVRPAEATLQQGQQKPAVQAPLAAPMLTELPPWRPRDNGPMMDAEQDAMLQHLPLVRSVAIRVARHLRGAVDVDELINMGVVGLIDAIRRFDASRGTKFSSYAELRIRGAIMDALRVGDHVPRRARRRRTLLNRTRDEFYVLNGRQPTRAELATALGVTDRELDTFLADGDTQSPISLDSALADDTGTTVGDTVPADGPSVEDSLLGQEALEGVREAIERLPENERRVIMDYYYQSASLSQIGGGMNLSESRICQIRKEALGHLRALLAEVTDASASPAPPAKKARGPARRPRSLSPFTPS